MVSLSVVVWSPSVSSRPSRGTREVWFSSLLSGFREAQRLPVVKPVVEARDRPPVLCRRFKTVVRSCRLEQGGPARPSPVVSGNYESGVARHRRCRRVHTRVSRAARSHEQTRHCRHGGTQRAPHLRALVLSLVTPSPHHPPLGGRESSSRGRRTTGAAQDVGS